MRGLTLASGGRLPQHWMQEFARLSNEKLLHYRDCRSMRNEMEKEVEYVRGAKTKLTRTNGLNLRCSAAHVEINIRQTQEHKAMEKADTHVTTTGGMAIYS